MATDENSESPSSFHLSWSKRGSGCIGCCTGCCTTWPPERDTASPLAPPLESTEGSPLGLAAASLDSGGLESAALAEACPLEADGPATAPFCCCTKSGGEPAPLACGGFWSGDTESSPDSSGASLAEASSLELDPPFEAPSPPDASSEGTASAGGSESVKDELESESEALLLSSSDTLRFFLLPPSS